MSYVDLCRFFPASVGTADFVYVSAVPGCQSPALAGIANASYHYYAVSADQTQWELGTGIFNTGTNTQPRTTVLYNSAGTGTGTGQSGAGAKTNFSTIPQVSIVITAEDIITYLTTIAGIAAGGGLAGTYPNPTVSAVPATAMPALTGDVTSAAGSVATAVAKIGGVTPGPYATALAGQLPGTATNDNAAAGDIGEYVTASVLFSSPVSIVTATAKTIISISLTAGDWDVSGVAAFNPAGTTVTASSIANISLTNNALNANWPTNGGTQWQGSTTGTGQIQTTDVQRVSVNATTTVYLIAYATFSVSTNAAYGTIRARRVR